MQCQGGNVGWQDNSAEYMTSRFIVDPDSHRGHIRMAVTNTRKGKQYSMVAERLHWTTKVAAIG